MLKRTPGAMNPDICTPAVLVVRTQEQRFIVRLIQLGQRSLFELWPAPGTDDEGKKRLVAQLLQLDAHYPSGLAGYIANAKQLLKDARQGVCR